MEPTAPDTSQDQSHRTTLAKTGTPSAFPEATSTSPDKLPVGRTRTVETNARKAQEAPARRAQNDATHAPSVRRPAVTRQPNIPVAPRRHHPIVVAATVAIVAFGIGAPWLRMHSESVARAHQPPTVVASDAATEGPADAADRALPTEHPVAGIVRAPDRGAALPRARPAGPAPATHERKSTTATSSGSAPLNRPKPVTGARPARRAAAPAVAPKLARATESPRESPAVPVLNSKPSAPVLAAPVVAVAAAAPASAPPAAAVGPFFETRDVTESPRVEKRSGPQLPDELKGHSIKEVVVVRALVSQSGHASRVSLLRRSKAGPQLDDVVVAAVNQWTFSPAQKKGEAVSCWFNFAVELGGVE
jgi:TonB family protein